MGETIKQRALTRRGFLATTAALAGAGALGGSSLTAFGAFDDDARAEAGDKTVSVMCRSNCMGSCRWLAHVRDDRIVKLEPADYPTDLYRGGCLKGYAYIERIYSPTRVKQPLKRATWAPGAPQVQERGKDEWEAISWDEAIKYVADEFARIRDTYGPRAIFFDAASGQYGYHNGIYSGPLVRLCGVIGAEKAAVSYDYACGNGINRVLGTGDWAYCNEPNSVLDSSMMIIWGTNPVFTAPQNWRWIQIAKEQGTRVICLDPIKSATAHRSDEYIYVTPGNDGYLALAMCNYLVQNDLYNKDFVMKKSTGTFLVRKDTKKHLRLSNWMDDSGAVAWDGVLGSGSVFEIPETTDVFFVWDNAVGAPVPADAAIDPALEGTFVTADGIEVTTAFTLLKAQLAQYSIAEASRLCGPSEERIIALANSFATERAISVNVTYGCDHYVNGYLTTWAMATLLALSGQLGRPGAGFTGVATQTYTPALTTYWFYTPGFKGYNAQIPNGLIPKLIQEQKLEGVDHPVKAMLSYCHNPISNMVGQNEWLRALPNLDLYVVLDMELNDSGRYCDIFLPVASWYEKEDLRTAYNNPYITYSEQAIQPLYDTKTDWDIGCMLGRAMGYEADFPETFVPEYGNALLFSDAIAQAKGFSVDRIRAEKAINMNGPEYEGKPWIRGYSAPWPTESQRVQLYCENPTPRLLYGHDFSDREDMEHVPYYREPDECGPNSPLKDKYPLIYLQEHARFRVHTQWFETPMLRELDPEPLGKINSIDAAARGVQNGDYIRVFNDRGFAVVRALIDESIAPGIVSIPKGWQRNQFKAGCYQEMTNPKMDPYADSISPYDTRVDFEKWEEE